MPTLWISCPSSWNKDDLQAALNVIITILSFLASFAFVRCVWQSSANQAIKGNDVPLHSLLTIGTPGEVLDALALLRRNFYKYSYTKICAQSLVIILLSATTIFSGYIAKFSSRQIQLSKPQEVTGSLASKGLKGDSYQTSSWEKVVGMLGKAQFPENQLLDFLPNTDNGDWVYEPSQWNNTWTMDCNHTVNEQISLQNTRNCSNIRSEIQGLDRIVPPSKYPHVTAALRSEVDFRSSERNGLLVVYGTRETRTNETHHFLPMTLIFIHLQNGSAIPKQDELDRRECYLRNGSIKSAKYSRAECMLARSSTTSRSDVYRTHPEFDENRPRWIPEAVAAYYYGQFEQEAWTASGITIVPPEDLVRFYQAYLIVKDALRPSPVTRVLSVNVSVVQISIIFVIITSLTAALVLLALVNIVVFMIRHRHSSAWTPESKVDWMLQSIEAEDRPRYSSKAGGPRKSVTVDVIPGLHNLSLSQRQRAEFEVATFGARETTTWFSSEVLPHATLSSRESDSLKSGHSCSNSERERSSNRSGNGAAELDHTLIDHAEEV